jgi:hypothetical protein
MAFNIKSLRVVTESTNLTAKDDNLIYDGTGNVFEQFYLPSSPVVGQTHSITIKAMDDLAAANFYGSPFLIRVTPAYSTATLSIRNSLVEWTLSFTFDGTEWILTRTHPVPGKMTYRNLNSGPSVNIEAWDDLLHCTASPLTVNLPAVHFTGQTHRFLIRPNGEYSVTLTGSGSDVILVTNMTTGGSLAEVSSVDISVNSTITTVTWVGDAWLTDVTARFETYIT